MRRQFLNSWLPLLFLLLLCLPLSLYGSGKVKRTAVSWRDWLPDSVPQPWKAWDRKNSQLTEGVALALLLHESGHLLANLSLRGKPRLTSVHYGFLPFFAIEPTARLSDRARYLISSAGFHAQHLTSEWVLTKHPYLKKEKKPVLKGILVFNYWLSVGYAVSSFFGSGPDLRDTKTQADAARVNEALIGTMLLAPALLDSYRYHHPEKRWARDASRLFKLSLIGLAFRARR